MAGIVHFGQEPVCGYRAAIRWAGDGDRWTDDQSQLSCKKCLDALKGRVIGYWDSPQSGVRHWLAKGTPTNAAFAEAALKPAMTYEQWHAAADASARFYEVVQRPAPPSIVVVARATDGAGRTYHFEFHSDEKKLIAIGPFGAPLQGVREVPDIRTGFCLTSDLAKETAEIWIKDAGWHRC